MYQVKEYLLPVNGENRIAGYDIARGIAILLMLIINFKGALSLHESYPEWISDIINFLDRRAAVALVIVSGIGLTLFMKNPGTIGYVNPRPGSRRKLIDRAAFLFLSGYTLSIIWAADILHFYAVFIFIGVFMAARSNRFLFTTAVIFWMVSLVQFFEIYGNLQDDQYYNFIITHLINLFFTGYYPVFPWAAFFIAGMFLGRLDLQDKYLRRRIMTIGLFLLIFIELISRHFVSLSESIRSASSTHFDTNMVLLLALGWIMEIDLTIPTPFSVVSGLCSGIIVVMAGVSLSLSKQTKLVRYMIIGGRNTLTIYIGHIVFLILFCEIFKVSNSQGVISAVLGATLFFFVYIKGISLWFKKYNNGPVETIMRRFSFQRLFLKKPHNVIGSHV